MKKKYYEPEFELERITFNAVLLLKTSYGEGEVNVGAGDGDNVLAGEGFEKE